MTNSNRKPETIVELKEMAFKIPNDGVITYYPQWKKEDAIIPSKHQLRVFNSNNGILAFIDEAGKNYVVPFILSFQDILIQAGYTKASIFVPFSNWDYPKYYKGEWQRLLKLCEQFEWEVTREKAREIAKRRNVMPIPQEIANKTLEIPVSGIKVISFQYETIVYPNISSHLIDNDNAGLIGTYYYNNGTYVIQSDDGRTYSVKHFDGILNLLQEAGYVEKAQYVPFSNGEKIIS